MTRREALEQIYDRLFEAYGPQHWWPSENEFETILGAYLTQNTTWRNAATAISRLKTNGPLTPRQIEKLPADELRERIRPAGYFNQKAKKIEYFLQHLRQHYRGRLDQLLARPAEELRPELLDLWGVGPETADSILLYAACRPIFVVDKYTIRLFSRHGLVQPDAGYHEVQDFVHRHLPRDVDYYNEYHALIVRASVEHCRTRPLCEGCPLESLLTRVQRAKLRDLQRSGVRGKKS